MAYLDWAAVAAGMIGTALWAHKGPWAKWASAWWFASSALWLVFAWQHQLLALALEMAATLGLVGYGLWTWVLRGQAPREGPPVAEAVHARPLGGNTNPGAAQGRERAVLDLQARGQD